MVGVDQDDLVVLVHTVLVHPVRVEHAQVAATPADALFRDAAEAALELEVVHTLADGLAVGRTCMCLQLQVNFYSNANWVRGD